MLVTLDDVLAAARRIEGTTVPTPLIEAPFSRPGQPLWLKAENLQVGGAFKLRGATNAIAVLVEEDPPGLREHGVVTHSSGNHAQALARAARAFGLKATIVMPHQTPDVKREATAAMGAEVVLVDIADRAARTAEIQAETGAVFVPPYDHPQIIAGQGTVGLEVITALPEVETVLVPVSGGGLVSGIAVAVKGRRPDVRVVAVEPELAGDLADSRARGTRVEWSAADTGRTIADGLRVTSVGELNWDHIKEYVDDVVTVSEDAIVAAMRRIVLEARLVVEPSGAVATAAYFERPDIAGSGPTVAILSGGNVEPALLASVLAP
jgi:threonine dehydratase